MILSIAITIAIVVILVAIIGFVGIEDFALGAVILAVSALVIFVIFLMVSGILKGLGWIT